MRHKQGPIAGSTLLLMLLASLALALAPFQPEPHLLGKIRWVAGGAEGMQIQDWADLLMHGLPITVLSMYLISRLLVRKRNAH